DYAQAKDIAAAKADAGRLDIVPQPPAKTCRRPQLSEFPWHDPRMRVMPSVLPDPDRMREMVFCQVDKLKCHVLEVPTRRFIDKQVQPAVRLKLPDSEGRQDP